MILIINKIKNNNLMRNIFSLSILQVVSAILSIVLIPLLARVLEPSTFGLVMFIHLITSYFIWFSEWGFSQGGAQKIAIFRSEKAILSKIFNQIYSSQLFLVILAVIPLFFTLYFFQAKYHYDILTINLILVYFILSSSIPIWFLSGIEKVTFAIVVQIYPKILALLSVIFFLKKPDDYLYYFISLILGLVIAMTHCFIEIFKTQKIFFSIVNPYTQLKENFNYFISSFTKTMTSNIIPFFLSLLTSVEIFGFYALADKIKGAILIILNPIYQSLFPRMCHIVNQKSYYSYLRKYSIFIILLILVLSLSVFFFIDYIVFYFVGIEYHYSSELIKWMIPSIIMNSLVSICFYFVLIPFNLSKSIMKVSLLNFIFILIISYPIIGLMKSYGAIIILTISEIIFLLFYIYIINKNNLLKK